MTPKVIWSSEMPPVAPPANKARLGRSRLPVPPKIYCMCSARRGSKPLTCLASAASTRGSSAAIGSNKSVSFRTECDATVVSALNVDPSMLAILYGPPEMVSTPKPLGNWASSLLTALQARDKHNGHNMSGNQHQPSRRKDAQRIFLVPLVCCMFVLLIGCKRSPEQAAVKTANALLDEGHIKTALTLVDESLLQNPDSASLLRMRVVLLLRAGDLSAASAALQKIPAGKSITGELLRHRDHVVR